MEQVRKRQALTKMEFHQRLRQWFQGTGEQIVGADWVDGRTHWIYVRDATNFFALHSDTSRGAVEWYLHAVAKDGDDLQWEVAPSQRGKMTAVVFGPKRLRNPSFYLYVVGSAA